MSLDPALVLDTGPRRLNVLAAARHILRIRTNLVLRRRHLSGRILTVKVAATATLLLFIPAVFTRDLVAALP